MNDTPDDSDTAAAASPSGSDESSRSSESRRKRRGTGRFLTTEQQIAQTQAAARARAGTAAQPASPARADVVKPKFGRYERPDFERVENMLVSFASRRFNQFVNQVLAGFFGAASAEEKANPELRTAGLSFCIYGYRDPKGIRIIDMFAQAGLPLDGRQRAALDACLQARLVLATVDDVNPGKQRLRGKDLLRDEPITIVDHNLSKVLRAGDRVLSWQIPWGTSWQPIGVAQRVEARRAVTLDRGLDSLCDGLRVVRRELSDRHGPNLFWLVHKVANLPRG